MNRRRFLKTTAASTIAFAQSGTLLALESDRPYRDNIGLQLYTLRKELEKDAASTLKQVAAAGYKQVELFSFPDSAAMISGARDAGLAIHSAHFQWDSVIHPKDAALSDFSRILEKAQATGLSHLVIPYLDSSHRKTLDDYKKVAEQFNKAATLAKTAGIQLSYHNHNFEFAPLEGGKCGYDIYREAFSSEMMFEIDVFWVKAAGLDPVEFLENLKGRVTQLHLKDLKVGFQTPSYSEQVPADTFQELGRGMISLERVIQAAKAAGVQYCHVEQDESPDAMASIVTSMDYLKR